MRHWSENPTLRFAAPVIAENLATTSINMVVSSIIGEMVMDGLKQLDEVAYVRFASVYRQFRDIQTFRDELNKLLTDFEPGTTDGKSSGR